MVNFLHGRYAAKILTALLFGIAFQASANPSPEGNRFLLATKTRALQKVELETKKYYALKSCFENETRCRSEVRALYQDIKGNSKTLVANYRELLILARYDQILAGVVEVRPFGGYPATRSTDLKNSGALDRAYNTRLSDSDVIAKKWAEATNIMKKSDPNWYYDDHEQRRQAFFAKSREEAQILYIDSLRGMLQDYPLLPYLSANGIMNDVGANDVITAINQYLVVVQNSQNILFDEQTTPLENFIFFDPIVNDVLREHPEWIDLARGLRAEQSAESIGWKHWVNTLSSTKGIAFNSCFLIAAITEAWPLALACGAASLTSASLDVVNSYFAYEREVQLMLSGVSSLDRADYMRGRVFARTIMLAIVGLGFKSTVESAQGSITSALQLGFSKSRLTDPKLLASSVVGWGKGFISYNAKSQSITHGFMGFGENIKSNVVHTYHFMSYGQTVAMKDSFNHTQMVSL